MIVYPFPNIRDHFSDNPLPLTPNASQGDEVIVWGTGTPMREFLYVDDMADGCVFVMESDDETLSKTLLNYPDSPKTTDKSFQFPHVARLWLANPSLWPEKH